MSRRPASFATASPTPPVPRSAGPDDQPAAAGSSEIRVILGVIDQCEYATDLLFKERGVLETVRDDLAAMTGFGAVLRFFDRKPHPAFTGEVTIDRKTRPEG